MLLMTLQEMIKSFDGLSEQDQDSLLQILNQKRKNYQNFLGNDANINPKDTIASIGDRFWEGVQRFRQAIEEEGIEFTDEDWADLRDRSPGREVEL
jgi:hypothetical protein